MSETKAQLENKLKFVMAENEELRAENKELRKFVLFVRNLETDEDFLNLKHILKEANKKFFGEEDK